MEFTKHLYLIFRFEVRWHYFLTIKVNISQ